MDNITHNVDVLLTPWNITGLFIYSIELKGFGLMFGDVWAACITASFVSWKTEVFLTQTASIRSSPCNTSIKLEFSRALTGKVTFKLVLLSLMLLSNRRCYKLYCNSYRFVGAWNSHPLSSENGRSPNQLWSSCPLAVPEVNQLFHVLYT